MHGHHMQCTQVGIIFNYMFYHAFIQVITILPSGTEEPASEMCIFQAVINTCSWKSKIKHVGKYDVYLDILQVSIYVAIKCAFFREHQNI